MVKLKRKLGDRYDGYRVRNVDPFFLLIPYIMKTRVDSQVYFSDRIEITELERFVRKHASTYIKGLKMYHVLTAAIVRLISQRPYLNRFVSGNKLYARNHVSISMSVKRSMSEETETTVVKPIFELTDTLSDIVRKFNEEVDKNKIIEAQNQTDFTAKLIGHLPSFFNKVGSNYSTQLGQGWASSKGFEQGKSFPYKRLHNQHGFSWHQIHISSHI